jgi:aminoglycoside phosphotransferase family enzyme
MYNFNITNTNTGSSTSVKNGSIKTILKVLSQFRKSTKNEAVINKSGKVCFLNTKEDSIIEQLDKLLQDKKETN